jgi:glyoxalase family protein
MMFRPGMTLQQRHCRRTNRLRPWGNCSVSQVLLCNLLRQSFDYTDLRQQAWFSGAKTRVTNRRYRIGIAEVKLANKIRGLHHVTAIAGDPQQNLDFYVGLLGLRFVKRTINFDDPGTYHFYFGDNRGTPGTILTFFPWLGARRGIRGTGQIEATAFAISPDSIGYWLERFKQQRVTADRISRFGEEAIRFADPDGLLLELIGSKPLPAVEPWPESSVPQEHSLHGFHSVSAALEGYETTARLLTDSFGYRLTQHSGNRFRFASVDDSAPGRIVDLLCLPDTGMGRVAAGSVHHIAFRAKDDAEQLKWREHLVALGYNVTPVIDRTYFHSIYFREPGGVLFEIATEPPGFTLDEKLEELGTHLRVPPWLESAHSQIEGILPPIQMPSES